MLLVTLVLAVVVGVTLGLLGGGGSILTVPLLVYVAGQDPKVAIATSLLVVAVTSAAGAVPHALAGRVRWRTGLVFGAAGMVGAYGGGRLSALLSGEVLLAAFGVVMAGTAVAMLRGRTTPTRPARDRSPLGRTIIDGTVVGAVTGLVGAGGGFLVVPALALLGGLPMATAVGTSLVVITLKSGAGLVGYLAETSIDWPLALAVTAAAVLGSVIAGRFADRVPEAHLRTTFGGFVAVSAAVLLAGQVPATIRAALLGHPVTWVAGPLAITAVVVVAVLARRRRPGPPPSGTVSPRAARSRGRGRGGARPPRRTARAAR